jgi:hypothetical protein
MKAKKQRLFGMTIALIGLCFLIVGLQCRDYSGITSG